MPQGAIARRYADAIFDIARRQNSIDRTFDDVREIARLFAHRKLAFLLREPKIPAKRKETAIRQALTDRVLPTSLNLALLVVQRELVDIMPNIARELEQLVLDYKNQAKAEVTTARPIDDAQIAEVKQALERRTVKTILISTKVQPDILGGVIARVGDQLIDASIRTRLSILRQQLLRGVANDSGVDFLTEAGVDGRSDEAEKTLQNPPSGTTEPSKIQSS
jgi:F-type H+-transporting ATPase subunit delta